MEEFIVLRDRDTHINLNPDSGAILYIVDGIPYVRSSTGIIALKDIATSDGVATAPVEFDQVYATADPTLSAYTPDTESVVYTGALDSEAKLADLNHLRVAYENLRVFVEDIAKMLNSVIDNEQALGIASVVEEEE